jgi:hypothetical protein
LASLCDAFRTFVAFFVDLDISVPNDVLLSLPLSDTAALAVPFYF